MLWSVEKSHYISIFIRFSDMSHVLNMKATTSALLQNNVTAACTSGSYGSLELRRRILMPVKYAAFYTDNVLQFVRYTIHKFESKRTVCHDLSFGSGNVLAYSIFNLSVFLLNAKLFDNSH